MNGFLLHLQGPMMSFADTGFGQLREAGPFPSRSAVIGIVAAALGVPRGGDDLLKLHGGLRVHVATVRPGTLGIDYHTVKPSEYDEPDELLQRRTPADVNAVQTYRGYHQDAHFVALVEGSDVSMLEECRAALRDPVYIPFLGRRSCPPSTPLLPIETTAGTVIDALCEGTKKGYDVRPRKPWDPPTPAAFDAYIDGELFEQPAECSARPIAYSSRRDLLVALPRSYVNRPVLQIRVELPNLEPPSSSTTNEEYFDAAS